MHASTRTAAKDVAQLRTRIFELEMTVAMLSQQQSNGDQLGGDNALLDAENEDEGLALLSQEVHPGSSFPGFVPVETGASSSSPTQVPSQSPPKPLSAPSPQRAEETHAAQEEQHDASLIPRIVAPV